MTDLELVAALDPRQVLALTIYGEARGEHVEGKIAVGCVIRNRVALKRWGDDYKSVCLAPWQFSSWKREAGEANYETVLAAARTLLRMSQTVGPDLRECCWIADGVISLDTKDRVNGATHYCTFELLATKPPLWAKGLEPVTSVQNHVFFKGVR